MYCQSKEDRLKYGIRYALSKIGDLFFIHCPALSEIWDKIPDPEKEKLLEDIEEVMCEEISNSLYEDPLF